MMSHLCRSESYRKALRGSTDPEWVHHQFSPEPLPWQVVWTSWALLAIIGWGVVAFVGLVFAAVLQGG